MFSLSNFATLTLIQKQSYLTEILSELDDHEYNNLIHLIHDPAISDEILLEVATEIFSIIHSQLSASSTMLQTKIHELQAKLEQEHIIESQEADALLVGLD